MKRSVLFFTAMALTVGTHLQAQTSAITLKTTKMATPITMEFACQDSTTLLIDWGDGVKVETVAVADSATAFLERGYERTEISGTPVGETIHIYGDKILFFDASSCGLTSLTINNAPLKRLFASSNDLTSLDVTNLPDLEYLEINTNENLGAIDVTKNPKLTRFVVNNTAIENINLSQNPDLYYLNVNNTKLGSLDVTKNTKLGSLYALNLGLTNIDLTQNKKMFFLSMNGNNLESLNLASCDTLIYLYASSNKFKDKDAITFPVQSEKRVFNMMNLSKNYFKLSTLPDLQEAPMTSSRYTYAPQAPYQIEQSYEVGQMIDLSSEKEVKGILEAPVATTYTWATQSGTVLTKGTDYEEPETGVFKFLTAPKDSVVCTMSTTAFPKFKSSSSYKTVATKIELANSIGQNMANAPYAVAVKGAVRFMNIESATVLSVMSLNGQIIYTGKPVDSIALPAAVYVIKIDGTATKVAVR